MPFVAKSLLRAAGAALLLAADFVALLALRRLIAAAPLLKAIGQQTPGQEAVEPLGAAALDLDREARRTV